MERPKDQPERQIHLEPDDVLPLVQRGKYGIRQFSGQIGLYVPNDRVERLGRDGLRACLDQVYGAETMKEWGSSYQHPSSLLLELPPQREKVEALITLIDRMAEPPLVKEGHYR